MSDKLTLSAVISVLMMTSYILFGGDAMHAPHGSAGLDAPIRITVGPLPSLKVVLAKAGGRHILY